jgi:hypothetical protein
MNAKVTTKGKTTKVRCQEDPNWEVWGFPHQATITRSNGNTPRDLIHLWHIYFKYEV